VLNEFYDWLLEKQQAGAEDPAEACKAKTSIIAHSMGNYVLQKAMQYTWTRKNKPLLTSLVTQLLMIAADVDNDLFRSGQVVDQSDGDAKANSLARRSTRARQHSASAGSSTASGGWGAGLDRPTPHRTTQDVDCSTLIPPDAQDIHRATSTRRRRSTSCGRC
jgi:esterase/lipase superfamily enzyme